MLTLDNLLELSRNVRLRQRQLRHIVKNCDRFLESEHFDRRYASALNESEEARRDVQLKSRRRVNS